jgi:thiol-disulfide isomerase/thioredoxin
MRRVIIMGVALLVGIWLILMQRTPQSTCPPLDATVEVGRSAPAFALSDLDGKQVSLGDFKGKVVLLDFWATWCGPCRLGMPVLEKLQLEHPNDFTLLAVNIGETPDTVTPYVERQKIQARIPLDVQGCVAAAYQAISIPRQVLIDKEGIVRFIRDGYHSQLGEELWSEITKLH